MWWLFGRKLPATYAPQNLPSPVSALRDSVVCWTGTGLLLVLLVSFFIAPRWGVPESLPAIIAAALLWFAAWSRRRPAWTLLRSAPWSVVGFSLGMYLVVYGLRNAGLTRSVTDLFSALARQGWWALVFGVGGLMALASSVANNLPALLIGALGIQQAHLPLLEQTAAVYANIVAANVGSKLTPLGNLATLLWLSLLSDKGWHVSWREYLRRAWAVTLTTLLLTLAALAVRLGG